MSRLEFWSNFVIAFCFFIHNNMAYVDQGPLDYCEGETFRAECGEDEVVVMRTAIYGRMKLGRCVKVDMGYIGCQSDVLDLVDRRCSGRRKCEIGVPDTTLERTQPCLELKSYLTASFVCQKILPVESSLCRSSRYIRVTAPEGIIGSVTSQETWCGSGAAPWLIEALPGQNINISLIDFSYMSRGILGGYGSSYSDSIEVCQKYATIREDGPSRDTVICGGRNKLQHVYLSNSNSVKIEVEARSKDPHYFLIQYQVIGCPDPHLQSNAWFRRKNDQITIGCKGSTESWQLKCGGSTWIGNYGNCSQDAVAAASEMRHGIQGLPRGIIISAVIAIALIVGVIVLLAGVVLVKRNKNRHLSHSIEEHPPVSPKSTEESDMDYDSDDYDEPNEDIYLRPESGVLPGKLDPVPKPKAKTEESQYKATPHCKPKNNRTGTGGLCEQYTHIWEMPLPTPGQE